MRVIAHACTITFANKKKEVWVGDENTALR